MAHVKGILKNKKSECHTRFEAAIDASQEEGGGIQWDEMNILMTEHPANKDYGHMKIDEPKTPYHELISDEQEPPSSSSNAEAFSPDDIAVRMLEASKEPQHNLWEREFSEEEELTDEEKLHKKEFSEWRKKHYNEFYAVKRAKQLMKEEEVELEEESAPSMEEGREEEEVMQQEHS